MHLLRPTLARNVKHSPSLERELYFGDGHQLSYLDSQAKRTLNFRLNLSIKYTAM